MLSLLQGVTWAWQAYWEALGLVQQSALKVLRALQTLWRTLVLVCNKVLRHRLTLTIRLHRCWHRTRHKVSQSCIYCVQGLWRIGHCDLVAFQSKAVEKKEA